MTSNLKELACVVAGATTASLIMSFASPFRQATAVACLTLSVHLPSELNKYAYIGFSSSMIGLLTYKLIEIF